MSGGKKVFAGIFGYEPGRYTIPKNVRTRIEEMRQGYKGASKSTPFDEADFVEMEEVLDICDGAWRELRAAVSPTALAQRSRQSR